MKEALPNWRSKPGKHTHTDAHTETQTQKGNHKQFGVYNQLLNNDRLAGCNLYWRGAYDESGDRSRRRIQKQQNHQLPNE